MDVPEIARFTFTSEDRLRDELHNFNLDGFDWLYPAVCRLLAAYDLSRDRL